MQALCHSPRPTRDATGFEWSNSSAQASETATLVTFTMKRELYFESLPEPILISTYNLPITAELSKLPSIGSWSASHQ